MLLILILADYKFLMYQRDALYYIACITIETKKYLISKLIKIYNK